MSRSSLPRNRRRRGITPLGGLLAGIVLSSCTGTSGVPGVAQPDPLSATTTATGSFAKAVVRSAMVEGESSQYWELRGMSADQRRLFLRIGTGSDCDVGTGLVVEETDKAVTINAMSKPRGHAENCASNLKTVDGYVDLKVPLGHRELLHGPLGVNN